jgi:hypothetical protein
MNAGEIDSVLKVDDFDVSYALEVDPEFMEAEYPLHWADVYDLMRGFYDLRLHGVAFSRMNIAMLPLPEGTNAPDALRDEAVSLVSDKPISVAPGGRLIPGRKLFQLQTRAGNSAFRIEIESPGKYALLADKSFEEFQAALLGPSGIVELEQVLVLKSKSSRGLRGTRDQRVRQNRPHVRTSPVR